MYKYVQKSRNQRKADMVFVMGGRCQVCGYDTCSNALDFHHIDPKTKCVNLAKSTSLSWDRIDTEQQKCALLCSNCHRELHAGLITKELNSPYLKNNSDMVRKRIESFSTHKTCRCKICGAAISGDAITCPSCYHSNTRRVERPSRDVLKDRIRNSTFAELSRELSVSDNAIRKWCKNYGLPDKVAVIKSMTDAEWESV